MSSALPTTPTFGGKLVKGVLSSSVFSFYGKLLTFGLSFVLFRALSLQEYGTYQLVIAAWGVITVFLFQGLFQPLLAQITRLSKADDRPQEALVLTSGYFLLISLMCVALFLFVNVFYAQSRGVESSTVAVCLRLLSFSLLVYPFGLCTRLFFSLEHEFFWMNVITAVEDTIKTLLILLGFFVLHIRNAELVIAAIVAASLFTNTLFVLRLIPRFRGLYRNMRLSALRPVVQVLKEQGVWAVLQKQLRQLGSNVRVFVLEGLLGREAVALYSFAERAVTQFLALFPFDDVLVPLLSAEFKRQERIRTVFQLGCKYSLWIFTSIAVVLCVSSPFLITRLFPQYVGAIPTFQVLTLYVPVAGVAILLSSLFVSHHEQKTLFFLVLARWVWFAPLAYLLLRFFGLFGMGIEHVLSLLVFNVLRYRSLVKANPWLKIQWRTILKITPEDREVTRQMLQLWRARLRRKVTT